MFSNLSKREKRLLYLLLCIAIIAGGVLLLILPSITRNQEISANAAQVLEQRQDMEEKQKNLETNRQIAEELTSQADEYYRNQYAQNTPVENIDRYVTRVARGAGINLQALSIGTPTVKEIKTYEEKMGQNEVTLRENESASSGTASETSASTGTSSGSNKKGTEYIAYSLLLQASGSYDDFVRLTDALANCPQFLITSLTYQQVGDQGGISIGLDVYLLPSRAVS